MKNIEGTVTISLSDYKLIEKELEKVNKYFDMKEEVNRLKDTVSTMYFDEPIRTFIVNNLDKIENI